MSQCVASARLAETANRGARRKEKKRTTRKLKMRLGDLGAESQALESAGIRDPNGHRSLFLHEIQIIFVTDV